MDMRPLSLLWVKAGPLHPLDTGGKLRTYNILKELKKRHHITFLTLTSFQAPSDWEKKANEYCHEVIAVPWRGAPKFSWGFYAALARNLIFSNLPYSIEKYRSSLLEGKIKELEGQGYDLLICDFLTPAVNMNRTIQIPTVLFQHNVESQIWERHYEAQRRLLNRFYFWIQWKRMMAFEKHACTRLNRLVTVSPQDSEIFRNKFGLTNILGDVPTGVDTDYFYPIEKSSKKQNNLVFIGSMDWFPNEDAVLYFTEETYAKIKVEIPDVTFTVVGRSPSKKVMDLQEVDSTIHVTGTVEDIRPHVTSATAMVVPLRIAGGTRIKIFEGMAMGIPIVSTRIGAEGLPVVHNSNILLADTPEDFSRETIRLLKNPSKAKEILTSALEMVKNHYSWDSVAKIFESYCFKLLGESR